jgi:hypothetical protein
MEGLTTSLSASMSINTSRVGPSIDLSKLTFSSDELVGKLLKASSSASV